MDQRTGPFQRRRAGEAPGNPADDAEEETAGPRTDPQSQCSLGSDSGDAPATADGPLPCVWSGVGRWRAGVCALRQGGNRCRRWHPASSHIPALRPGGTLAAGPPRAAPQASRRDSLTPRPRQGLCRQTGSCKTQEGEMPQPLWKMVWQVLEKLNLGFLHDHTVAFLYTVLEVLTHE